MLNVIVISIHLYFGRKTSLSGSECVRMMEEEAEKGILFFDFFSKLFLLFLLLYAWTWKEEIDYKLFLVLDEAMCLSQNTGNDWNLKKPPFLFIIFYATTKKRRNRIVFWREIHYRWEKTITLLQARPPSVMAKRSCGVMITNIQHCSLLPSEMKFWSWNSNKVLRGRNRK